MITYTNQQVTWLVTEVWSDKLRAGYRAPSLKHVSYLRILVLCCACHLYFSQSSVVFIVRCLCACAYSTFGHHPHPKATLAPNFVSVAPLLLS